MLLLALHNIFRHKVRTFLTLAVIVFGVVGLILTGGFIEDIFIQLREATIHSQLGHLQILSCRLLRVWSAQSLSIYD